MTAATLFIGTAGWSLPTRFADAFPVEGTHLRRYAARLNAVEINSSFYRPHRRATYESWAASVPQPFRFAVKVPKTITHERRLTACDDLLDRFAGEVGGLGAKLGVLLVQLPPSLPFDAAVAGDFFAALSRRTTAMIACEPRHASWFGQEADALLKRHHVARVAADPPPADGAEKPGGWGGLVYIRLHGSPKIYYSDYDAKALAGIDGRLQALIQQRVPTWCVFDNTAAFHAIGNALAMSRRNPIDEGATGPSIRRDPA